MKKNLYILFGVGAVIAIVWMFFVNTPVIRYLSVDDSNQAFGESTLSFELQQGTYELHLYHYHFGNALVRESLGTLVVHDNNEQITFDSNLVEENIHLRIDAMDFQNTVTLTLDFDTDGSLWSAQPVNETIRRLPDCDEKMLVAYQLTSGMVILPELLNSVELGEQVDEFSEGEYIIMITIQNSNCSVSN